MTSPPTEPAEFGPGDSIVRPPVDPGAEFRDYANARPVAAGGADPSTTAGVGVDETGTTAGVGVEDGGDPPEDAATRVLHESAANTKAPVKKSVPHASRRLPGGRVVVIATLLIITVAMIEVIERGRIGQWTGITLIAVSAVAVLVTRPGDRALPAMMPPLAFLAAVVIAGQPLVSQTIDDPWKRQAVMIAETLGENAVWVVAASATAVLLALVGHAMTRRSRKRAKHVGGIRGDHAGGQATAPAAG